MSAASNHPSTGKRKAGKGPKTKKAQKALAERRAKERREP